MIDIFVINLKRSVERKQHITEQLNALHAQFNIFPAINGRDSEQKILNMYNDELSQAYRCKSLSKGQLGCYASHYLLWQKCVELNKPIIILEDDIVFDKPNFTAFYNLAPKLDAKYECIRLFSNHRRKVSVKNIATIDKLTINRSSKGHMRGMGYFLTPNGAKKFLQHSKQWYMAVDIYMDRFWINGVEPYGIDPILLTVDPSFDSDIGYEQNAKRLITTRCRREYFNFIENVKRIIHNLKFAVKHKLNKG
ncbi:glycosyltransferase family 25 protein [Moritella sp. Urea-trap-13]|uniref:glycosyltransferase family 25 protein n=1 Tax=Moritella sp. Urea-trap-13 TaxID=2058327 RepID=UPI000C32B18C|nr:glycosyltransferase family 25 protein [Moritella sp. Urea-trap-13]PKH05289.1 epitope biosynthesis protein [Moritella sp. Urea-trap-13]